MLLELTSIFVHHVLNLDWTNWFPGAARVMQQCGALYMQYAEVEEETAIKQLEEREMSIRS